MLIIKNYIIYLFQIHKYFLLKKKEDIEISQLFKNTIYGQSLGIANYVSSNHCQAGTILRIYEINIIKT